MGRFLLIGKIFTYWRFQKEGIINRTSPSTKKGRKSSLIRQYYVLQTIEIVVVPSFHWRTTHAFRKELVLHPIASTVYISHSIIPLTHFMHIWVNIPHSHIPQGQFYHSTTSFLFLTSGRVSPLVASLWIVLREFVFSSKNWLCIEKVLHWSVQAS